MFGSRGGKGTIKRTRIRKSCVRTQFTGPDRKMFTEKIEKLIQ